MFEFKVIVIAFFVVIFIIFLSLPVVIFFAWLIYEIFKKGYHD